MKIERIETFLLERWFLVRVHTDQGISGVGEGGLNGFPHAVQAVVDSFQHYLVGKDPLLIEHTWQYLYRFSHFRGAAVTSAVSAIDIALWDIKGKYHQVPVYELLGGKCRDKIRLYMHVSGETPEALAQDALKASQQGFTAVRFTPFAEDFYNLGQDRVLRDGVAKIAAVREAVGPDVDVCVEIHLRMSIPEAITFARELEPFRPFFYEDPITPDSVESMAEVARNVRIPIATGERLHTIYEFRELLQMRAAQYIRPDLCLAGGLTHCKKIAAVAESFNVGVIPHNPLSPISTAACVQLDACIPNFVLQEYTGEDKPPKSLMVRQPLKLERGYLVLPEEPGIGMELNDDFFAGQQWTPRPIDTPLRQDGSVADR